MLSALLSSNLEVEEKLDIIEKEYDIPIEEDIRKEVEEMCNLSQGIKEKAFKGGYTEGKQNGYAEAICLMYEFVLWRQMKSGFLCRKNKGFPQKGVSFC